MRKAAAKALYLFLCAILGMVLFSMLHRAIFVLYDLLIFVDGRFSFGLTSGSLLLIDFFALMLALFLGGWYGTMMGIDWYSMVYGPNAEVRAGLFHGFLPHNWRGKRHKKPASKLVAHSPAPTATVSKIAVTESPRPAVREWSFDDLITPKPVAKKSTAKRATARKTTRKTAAKKVSKSE